MFNVIPKGVMRVFTVRYFYKRFNEREVITLEFNGHLRVRDKEKLTAVLESISRQGYSNIILNFERLVGIDDACIEEILRFSLTGGGRLRFSLVDVGNAVAFKLYMSGLAFYLRPFNSWHEAVKNFPSGR